MTEFPKYVGVIQLPPLVGAPQAHGHHAPELLHSVGMTAVKEAQAFAQAGFDAVLIKNWGDAPYFQSHVPSETVACLSIITAAVREAVDIAVGIQVLGQDDSSALAIAAVTGSDFIQMRLGSCKSINDQLRIEERMAHIVRERERFHTPTAILAEISMDQGGGSIFSGSDFASIVGELQAQAGMDGLVVTSSPTARNLNLTAIQAASRFLKENNIPLYLDSELSRGRLGEVLPWVYGFTVGEGVRKGQRAGAPLEAKRVKEFFKEATQLSRKQKKGSPKKGKVSKK